MKPQRGQLALIFVLGVLLARSAAAQNRAALPPEVISLATKDGVQLKCTYFPASVRKGSPQAKQTAPVVLLPDLKGTRAMFTSLAERLQAPAEGEGNRPSFAVMTVDLRGHGESTTQVAGGGQTELDPARLTKNDLLAMVQFDMEAVRSFLVERNDAGELNLNKLCLIGSGLGASVAANWALKDWSTPPLAIVKQGQDVKALVLISPRWSNNGLSMQMPMRFRPLTQNAAWMLTYGEKDKKVKEDSERIRKQLARFHPQTDDAKLRSGLLEVKLPSTLQADTLLKQAGSAVENQIVAFLIENVAIVQQPWTSRLDKLP
jgi:pimeloyl-ACP methyl ester carboxylesterase